MFDGSGFTEPSSTFSGHPPSASSANPSPMFDFRAAPSLIPGSNPRPSSEPLASSAAAADGDGHGFASHSEQQMRGYVPSLSSVPRSVPMSQQPASSRPLFNQSHPPLQSHQGSSYSQTTPQTSSRQPPSSSQFGNAPPQQIRLLMMQQMREQSNPSSSSSTQQMGHASSSSSLHGQNEGGLLTQQQMDLRRQVVLECFSPTHSDP